MECSTRFGMLARKHQQNSLSRHSAVSRIVAGLLLVFVIYGTTIEAAHRHGRIFGSEQFNSGSVSSDNTTRGVAGSSLSCAECLICQLHQHFSASLVTVRKSNNVNQTSGQIFHAHSDSIQSRSTTTRSGRAPPLNS